MKKPIILVTALAMWAGVAVAQTENDILRANSRWERHLNSVWNDTLTPSIRDALGVEERKWIAWNDSLALDAQSGACADGCDYLREYARKHQ
jgi:hypothetical protein